MVRIQINDSPEEIAQRNQEKSRKRARSLVVILIVCVVARVFIKDPPKYQPPPDYSNVEVQYLPGMLDAMPEATRAQLTPEQLAKFQEADRRALTGETGETELATKDLYQPSEAPAEIQEDVEAYKEQLFQYAKKQRKIEEVREDRAIDRTKPMLVRFKRGGYIAAQKTTREGRMTRVRIDRSIVARYPERFIRSISDDAVGWEEPTPRGFVKIRPAKGVTMIVSKRTAKRIRIPKKRLS